MNKKQKTEEKACSFYASDYHFEMISLPYINKKLENGEEVLILTENNLQKTVKTLVSKISLSKEKKEKILKLNWKNEDSIKMEIIKKYSKDRENEKKNLIVFVKGNEKYIKDINENIEKTIEKNENIKIIDCYNMEEIGERINSIVKDYETILSTTGERKIEKL